jgi:chromosomal replication initiator protein
MHKGLEWNRRVNDKSELLVVWERAREQFTADETLPPQHKAWLSLTRPLGIVEDTALLAAPNEFAREYLDNRLRPYIAVLLTRELGRDIHVAVTVQNPDDVQDSTDAADPADDFDDFDEWPPLRPE